MGILKFDVQKKFICSDEFNDTVFNEKGLTSGVAYVFDFAEARSRNEKALLEQGIVQGIEGFRLSAARIEGASYGFTDEYLVIHNSVLTINNDTQLTNPGYYAVLECGPSTYYCKDGKKESRIFSSVADYWGKTHNGKPGFKPFDRKEALRIHLIAQHIETVDLFNSIQEINSDVSFDFIVKQQKLQGLTEQLKLRTENPSNTLIPSRSFLLRRNPSLSVEDLNLIYGVDVHKP